MILRGRIYILRAIAARVSRFSDLLVVHINTPVAFHKQTLALLASSLDHTHCTSTVAIAAYLWCIVLMNVVLGTRSRKIVRHFLEATIVVSAMRILLAIYLVERWLYEATSAISLGWSAIFLLMLIRLGRWSSCLQL